MRRSQDDDERSPKRPKIERHQPEIPGRNDGVFYQLVHECGVRIRKGLPDTLGTLKKMLFSPPPTLFFST